MKPSRRRSGESSSARSGGTIVTWLHMHEKFGHALGPRPLERQRGGGRGGLEADREEHHLAVGVLLGDPQGVERRVDHPDVGALGLGVQQRALRAGTRIMSPKQVKITPGSWASAMPSSTRPIGITHTGQPGPWTSSTFSGSRSSIAVLVDRVGVPAAHLHQLVVAARLDELRGSRPPARGPARGRGTRRRTSCAQPHQRVAGVDEQRSPAVPGDERDLDRLRAPSSVAQRQRARPRRSHDAQRRRPRRRR